MYKPKQLADRNDFRDTKFGNYQYLQMMSFYPVNIKENIIKTTDSNKRIIRVMRFNIMKKLSMY